MTRFDALQHACAPFRLPKRDQGPETRGQTPEGQETRDQDQEGEWSGGGGFFCLRSHCYGAILLAELGAMLLGPPEALADAPLQGEE